MPRPSPGRAGDGRGGPGSRPWRPRCSARACGQTQNSRRAAAELGAAALRGGRVEQDGERKVKIASTSRRVGREVQAVRQQGKHGRDAEPGASHVVRQAAEQFGARRVEPDLLLRLAQRGRFRRGVAGVDPAAGKRDLAGMGLEMRGALGQQHARDAGRGRSGPGRPRRPAVRRMRSAASSDAAGAAMASAGAVLGSAARRARMRSMSMAEK